MKAMCVSSASRARSDFDAASSQAATAIPRNFLRSSKGQSMTVALTRGDFERMTGDLLQRTKDTTELVMHQAGVKPGTLDEVILVSGLVDGSRSERV